MAKRKRRRPGETLLYGFIALFSLLVMVPFFIFFNTMHLMESRFPLIAFCSFSPFGAFLMYQFIRSIPDDSIEAARLEGASEWRIFWRIVFPQATPGIAAPVSYTHLDVYKRQPLYHPAISFSGTALQAVRLSPNIPIAILPWAKAIYFPRQESSFPNRRCV